MMLPTNPHKQSGVALIIVLLVVALVSIIATEMGSRLQLQVKRANNIKDANQAYWYALGAEQFARKSLKLLTKNNSNQINLEREWDKEFNYPLEGGNIQAQLSDMQACFNLNSLRQNNGAVKVNVGNINVTKARQPTTKGTKKSGSTTKKGDPAKVFAEMLRLADIEIDSQQIDVLRDSLIDWVDQDDRVRDFGAEDADYQSKIIPYLPANNFMASKSEIRLVNGFERKWAEKLLPLLCVIPSESILQINVNTLREEQAALLAALTGMSLEDAVSEIKSRKPEGWKTIGDFAASVNSNGGNLTAEKQALLGVNSKHFILRTKTRYNNASFAMTSVLVVDNNNKIKVVRREFGGVS